MRTEFKLKRKNERFTYPKDFSLILLTVVDDTVDGELFSVNLGFLKLIIRRLASESESEFDWSLILHLCVLGESTDTHTKGSPAFVISDMVFDSLFSVDKPILSDK